MKKLLVIILITLGFLSNIGLHAISTPVKKIRRLWSCRPSAAKRNNCSKNEITQSKKWLIGTSVATLTAILTVGGLVAGRYAYEAQKAKQQVKDDAVDLGITGDKDQRPWNEIFKDLGISSESSKVAPLY